MSSQLSSISSSRFDELNLEDIKMFVNGKKQHWFKRGYAGKSFGMDDIQTSLNGLEKYEMLTRQDL